jgi:hypothetical protein
LRARHITNVLLAFACLQIGCVKTEAAERKAVVRVTTGSVQINNWQHDLVEGTPNLGHWHWNPIYANLQGLKTIHANNGPDRFKHNYGPAPLHPNVTVRRISPRPESVYTRPNHIPFNTTPRPESNFVTTSRAPNVSVNLIHHDVSASLKNNQVNGTLAQRDASATLNQTKTNARLADKNVSGEMLPAAPQQLAPPRVATYGQNYGAGDDFAKISRGSSNQVEKSSVFGRIAVPKKSSKSKKPSLNY